MSSPREVATEIAKRFIGSGDNIELRRQRCADAIDTALRAYEQVVRAEERERAARIADTHFVNHKGEPSRGWLIHEGQCHQAIAAAIRRDDTGAERKGERDERLR